MPIKTVSRQGVPNAHAVWRGDSEQFFFSIHSRRTIASILSGENGLALETVIRRRAGTGQLQSLCPVPRLGRCARTPAPEHGGQPHGQYEIQLRQSEQKG